MGKKKRDKEVSRQLQGIVTTRMFQKEKEAFSERCKQAGMTPSTIANLLIRDFTARQLVPFKGSALDQTADHHPDLAAVLPIVVADTEGERLSWDLRDRE